MFIHIRIFFSVVFLLPIALHAHITGPDPGYAGAPGDSPQSCASQTCHTRSFPASGPVNAAGGGVFVTFSGGCTYKAGVPQTVTVKVVDPVNTHFGFQMTARLESNLASGQAGDFTAGANQIVLCSNGGLKGSRGCPQTIFRCNTSSTFFRRFLRAQLPIRSLGRRPRPTSATSFLRRGQRREQR